MSPDERRFARWVRETLLFDADNVTRDDDAALLLLEEVYRRRDAEDREHIRRRRRRRLGAAGGLAMVAVGGTAAAVLFRDQPSRPEAGAVCRATADLYGDAIALAAGADPIDGCRQLWVDGNFGASDGSVPPLVACVGPHGAVEIFPGEASVCERLGLDHAEPELSAQNRAVVALQDRLVEEINAAECRSVQDVAVLAERILSESGLGGWQVVVEPGTEAGVCGKASINTPMKTVSVVEF